MFNRARITLILAALALLAGCERGGDVDEKPPHLILISIDTLTYDALRAFNPEAQELPVLDALSRASRRYSRMHSTASWTLPSHASIFSGLYPQSHGALGAEVRMKSDFPTLAECMVEAGYETAAFTDGGYLVPEFGVHRGFDTFSVFAPDRRQHADAFRPAIRFLEQRRRHEPLFLFAHTYQLHDYFKVHPWTVEALGPFDDLSGEQYKACLRGERSCTPAQWQRLEDLYRAELRAVDTALGRLLSTLGDLGYLERSLLLLVSDHGEGFEPERSRFYHTGRLHADLVRVPLLISGTGVTPGSSDLMLSLVDLFPTIEATFGLGCGAEFEGRSFHQSFTGREPSWQRTVFASEFFYHWQDGVQTRELSKTPHASAAVTSSGTWLIRNRGGHELYRMTRDPHQHQNLATGDLPQGLIELLDQRAEADFGEAFEPDEELQRQLESLGYL